MQIEITWLGPAGVDFEKKSAKMANQLGLIRRNRELGRDDWKNEFNEDEEFWRGNWT